jgi:hypothetical protein
MDSMDRLLSNLPGGAPPPDLARRIYREIRARRRRTAALHLGVGGALGLFGLWAALPAILAGMPGLQMPGNSLELFLAWADLALRDLGRLLADGWNGLLALQGAWNQSGVYAVPGLLALGLSALLLLRYVLPPEEVN